MKLTKFTNLHIQILLNSYVGFVHSKITIAGDVVPYYTVTALVPTLK